MKNHYNPLAAMAIEALSLALLMPVLLMPALTMPALAQSEMEEIVVTADYRQTALLDLAASATVVDEEKILDRAAHHLEEILGMAANVNFANGASRSRFYQIRGIGERGQFEEVLIPSVGLIIDDVDFSGAGSVATLFDVSQVEILRGPQGTRYGANALAGLINVKTGEPTEVPEYRLQLEGGNFSTFSAGAVLSGPLVEDRLLYRIAMQKYESDGFNHNDHLDKETSERDEQTIRTKLRWLVSDTLSIDINGSWIDVDNGYDAFSLDNERDTLSDEPGSDIQEAQVLGAKLRWTGNEAFEAQAILGYGNADSEYGYDEDWVYPGFHPWGYNSTDYYARERKSRSSELRLISSEDAPIFGGSTNWLVGLYDLNVRQSLLRVWPYRGGDFESAYEIDRLALYAQADTSFSDRWSLTIGMRYEQFDATYRDSDGISFTPDEGLTGGRVVINRLLDGGSLLYFGISRGYKSAGFNPDGRLTPGQREFSSEGLWNYEIGLKGKWFDGRLSGGLALFYMDRRDVQISSSIEIFTNAPEFIELIGNAAEGRNLGLEIEGTLAVSERFRLYGSLGLLDTEYRDYVNPDPNTQSLGGREQAHAPGYQYSIGGKFYITDRLSGNMAVEAKDKFFFSDSHDLQSDSYALLHANIAYRTDRWQVSLWGRNLTDRDYLVRGFFFGNDPRNGYEGTGYTQLGEPRNFGVTFTLDL